MGPYCKYCGQRCFVPRIVPGRGPLILATCAAGADHDQIMTGYDHVTAINPRQRRTDRTPNHRTGDPT